MWGTIKKRMKSLRIAALLALGLPALSPVVLAVSDSKALSAYEQAVKAYVDAADREVRAMRDQADALTREIDAESRKRYQDFYQNLERTDEALSRLKKSDQRTFDKNKSDFERARDAAASAFQKARSG